MKRHRKKDSTLRETAFTSASSINRRLACESGTTGGIKAEVHKSQANRPKRLKRPYREMSAVG